ncbi:MAG: hypothetical protein KatS3mg055_1747 [Chloroflexus sp.]|nr:MAG: hypothetical protein KatS3mg055_1747 [Chloroflexus sp.]
MIGYDGRLLVWSLLISTVEEDEPERLIGIISWHFMQLTLSPDTLAPILISDDAPGPHLLDADTDQPLIVRAKQEVCHTTGMTTEQTGALAIS